MSIRTSLAFIAIAGCLAMALTSAPAHAQYLGHNTKGDFGIQSGTQAPPGWYVAPMYIRYDGDELLDRNGDPIQIDPEGGGSIDVNGYAAGVVRVTNIKLFGANYSFMIFPSVADNRLTVPVLDASQRSATGFGDLYVQPLNLGWHTKRADYIAGVGLFAPTGRYDAEADDNIGLGMWSLELFGGTTVYLDKAKSWSFAATAFYELHTGKEDSDVKVGDILTVEGGLGKSFKQGALTVGAAYYAQWKMSADDFGAGFEPPEGVSIGKHKVFGVGPELTIPLATKKKLIAFLNIRYFWESGARTTLEGNTMTVTATFPIPSVSLQ